MGIFDQNTEKNEENLFERFIKEGNVKVTNSSNLRVGAFEYLKKFCNEYDIYDFSRKAIEFLGQYKTELETTKTKGIKSNNPFKESLKFESRSMFGVSEEAVKEAVKVAMNQSKEEKGDRG